MTHNKANVSDIANNLVTTVAGKMLDARMGKALSDSLNEIPIERKTYLIKANSSSDIYSTELPLTFHDRNIVVTPQTNNAYKVICRTLGTNAGGYVEYILYKNPQGEPLSLHMLNSENANCPLIRVDSGGSVKLLVRGSISQDYSIGVTIIRISHDI